jgi:cobaltochelatase CobS
MTTINNIIDNYTAREAQAIFGDIIKANTTDDKWASIIGAAHHSDIVNNDEHPDSKKIGKMAPSQILRSMNANAMGYWVRMIALQDGDYAATEVHDNLLATHTMSVEAWPFASEAGRGLLDVVIADLVDLDETEDEAEDEVYEVFPTETANVSTPKQVSWDESMVDIANMAAAKASGGVITDLRTVLNDMFQLENERQTLATQLAEAEANVVYAAPTSEGDAPEAVATAMTPKVSMQNAQRVFGINSKYLDFMIATYTWPTKNNNVPEADPHYKFDTEALSSLLFSWGENVRSWIGGPTGSGKSTLVEQACARTGTELYRFNCHKETSTYNLIGKVDVKDGETFFKDGVLPRAMQRPSVLLLDEADAALGDITMALQPVLEGKSLMIGEDGARVVKPHPKFRITATGNTYGGGDSTGMYAAGVKMQSRASMNRYGVFINVDYMAPATEMKVVRNVVPSMSDEAATRLGDFLKAYRQSYRNGAVQTPISPRNTITMARMAVFYEPIVGAVDAVGRAINSNVVLSADEADADVIKGIADKALAF